MRNAWLQKMSAVVLSVLMVMTMVVIPTKKVKAATYGFTITADKTNVKKDDIVTVTIKNAEEINGIDSSSSSSFSYQINFDTNVFEVVDSGVDSDVFTSFNPNTNSGIKVNYMRLKSGTSIPANTVWGTYGLKVKKDFDNNADVSIYELKRTYIAGNESFMTSLDDRYVSNLFNGDNIKCSISYNQLSSDATLKGLTLSTGTLDPTFSSSVTDYKVVLGNSVENLTMTPTVNDTKAKSVTVNGKSPTEPVTLKDGPNSIPIVVTAEDDATKTYNINAVKQWRPTKNLRMFDIDELTISDEITVVEDGNSFRFGNSSGNKDIDYILYRDGEPSEGKTNGVGISGDSNKEISYQIPGKNIVIIYYNRKYTPSLVKTDLIGADATLSSDVAVHTKSITVTITPEEGKEFKTLPVVAATNGTAGEVTKVTKIKSTGNSYECVIRDISGEPKITVTGEATKVAESPTTSTTKPTTPTKVSISKATVSKMKATTYTGYQKKPSVTVKVAGKKLKKGTDYTVSYKNNTKVGTAKVIIKGKGNYTGSKTVTFKIKKRTKVAKGIYKVNSTGLYGHKSPRKSSRVNMYFKKGDKVTVTKLSKKVGKNRWVKVKKNGKTAYVFSKYLKL